MLDVLELVAGVVELFFEQIIFLIRGVQVKPNLELVLKLVDVTTLQGWVRQGSQVGLTSSSLSICFSGELGFDFTGEPLLGDPP